VHHVFCQECIDNGIGVEITLPDQMLKEGLARRRRLSRRGERKTAREVGGRMTAASGAIGEDGDVLTKDWMIEEKQTQSRSFRVSVNLFDKAKRQAQRQRRDWVIRIKMPENNDIAVLDWRVWRGWMLSNDAPD
jgi:hypothetical protein